MIVLLVLAAGQGGIGAHVASLVDELITKGDKVFVGASPASDKQFRFSERGAEFRPIEIPPDLHPSDMRAVRLMRRLLVTAEPDIVHAHGLRAGLAATLAGPTCPLLVTWHAAPVRGGLGGQIHKVVERTVGRAATVTLCASSDLVIRANAVGAKDVRYVPIAAPEVRRSKRTRAAIRASLGVSDDVIMVFAAGRLHPQKGYPTLVAAAARWRDMQPVPKVFIAGEGPSYLRLPPLISELRAPVTLLGHRRDVGDLLAASDVAVVTSLWEGRQRFAQEALISGVPLIATAVGGIPELVDGAAELIPPSDPEALDGALRRLAADPQRRADLAARGLDRARSWPTEASVAATVRDVYTEILM